LAVVLAFEMTGKSNPARMAMIEITTSSSISVKTASEAAGLEQ